MSSGEDPRPVVTIDGRRVVRDLVALLVGAEVVLLGVDFLFAYLDLIPLKVVQHLANLAREDGVGTWFGATQATAVGAVLGAIGWIERRVGRGAAGWWTLGALFAYIGLDDALGVHERVGSAVRNTTGSAVFDLMPSYSWQVVFVPIFGGAALFMLAFLWQRLSPSLRRGLFVALGCFVVAVGIDFVEGLDGVFDAIADALGVRHYTLSHAAKVTEEILEMLGTTTFLAVFATRLVEGLAALRIDVRLPPG
jgi:hypothetical protein